MNLEGLKDQVNKLSLPESSLKVINEILDQAILCRGLTEEEKVKLLGIINVEIESANIEANVMGEMAKALDEFALDLDQIASNLENKLK